METTRDGFTDRTAAGRELAAAVARLRLSRPLLVLALPRGGVPVAFEVARALNAPLDVLVVRKIGMPGQPEVAIGAIAAGGVVVREPGNVANMAGLDLHFGRIAQRERAELERRERAYRTDLPPLELHGQTAVLVDDGLATGATMLAAVRSARRAGAAAVIVAVPVASDEAVALVSAEADRVVALLIPQFMYAIGAWYASFPQLDDTEVCALLERARRLQLTPAPRSVRGAA
jgi:putative phosphoribosyl transferase